MSRDRYDYYSSGVLANLADGKIIFGDGVSDGSWMFEVVGTDMIRYRMESSVWIDKGAFLA